MVELLRYASPVAFAALGETVGQRAGVLNIGLEGMMLSAGFAAMLATRETGNPWVGLAAGIAVGIGVGLLSALFTLKLAADQVVIGTAINLLALGVTGALYQRIFGASGELIQIARLPRLAFEMDLVLIFLIALVPGLAWLLFRSRWGLVARAAGEYPPAVEASGFHVARVRLQAILIGSSLAGLAGAYLAVGLAGSFAPAFTNGKGFIAIAMVTFGRFTPWGAFAASLVVGYAETLQFQLQARGLQLPAQLFSAMPYLVALAVLVIVGRGTRAPAALGIPYERTQ